MNQNMNQNMNKYIMSIFNSMNVSDRSNQRGGLFTNMLFKVVKILGYIILFVMIGVISLFIYKFISVPPEVTPEVTPDCSDDKWNCSVKPYSMCIGSTEGGSIKEYIFDNRSTLGNIVTVNNPNTFPHELTSDNIILGDLDDSDEGCSKQNFQFICANPCTIKE